MENKKILLLGEFCEDKFIYGKCDRLNPEAPTPVFIPKYEEYNIGMAGNTYNNLIHLGLDVDTLKECKETKIQKCRFTDEISNYIILRVDTDDDNVTPIDISLINNISLEKYDVVIISDYDKGLLSKKLLEKLFLFCNKCNIITFMDTKKKLGNWSHHCDYIKINQFEYDQQDDQITDNNLIITLGNKGCKYNKKKYPTDEVEVRDVVGAGDTFLAGLVYGYLKNNIIEEGIEHANKLASNVVTKRGVALPNKKIIKQI